MVKKLSKSKMLLCAIVFIATALLAISSNSRCQAKEDTAYNQKSITNTIDSTNLKKDSLRNLMIDEVQTYINKNAPKAHKDLPTLLVDNGLQHNIDIAFMMAQAQYETSFGTAGAGRPSSRYSLFGVNGKFKNYEDAICKYITLLKNNYLTKGKTEQHLMKNYTNNNGNRYCPNSNYEAKLRKYYNSVIRVSNIRDFQKEFINL